MTYVLCRRDLSGFGEAPRFCSKPIKTKNDSDLCDECRSHRPFWPLNDDGSYCSPDF